MCRPDPRNNYEHKQEMGAAGLRKCSCGVASNPVHSRLPAGHSFLLVLWTASKNIFNEIFIEFQINVPT